MRHDHRPGWVRLLGDRLNAARVDWFIRPQFDLAGHDLRVINPGHLHVSGSGIHAGNHVHFMALPDRPIRLANFDNLGSISIGDYCIINPGVRVTSASSITIGSSCMLAMNCYLSDADWHDAHHRIFAPGATAPIVLRDNVWIGDSALITKGVTIGENSIVGAWSVVTKDVPANTIVAGNPARPIGEIDASHLTTRQHLFNGETPYHEFEHSYFEDRLKGNTLAGWLRSRFWPRPGD